MSEQLFITRKRKKYKFAKFDEFENCFQLSEWRSVLSDLIIPEINNGRKLIVEIGAGTALFLVELAKNYPENLYVAVDIKSDRLYTGARLANELSLNNIVFVRSDITKLAEIIPQNMAQEMWLTFPDPYANEDQTKLTSTGSRKRLTAPKFLKIYKSILKPSGRLNFKTDNQPLFDWSIEQLKNENWNIESMTRNLHASKIANECKIMTSYEKRFVSEGLPIYFLSATISR